MASLRKKQAPRITQAEWEDRRQIIEGLYHDASLQDVRRRMRQEYGFDATTSQYTTKLKQWGVTKYRSSAAWQALDSSLQRRGLDASNVDISDNGVLMPSSRAVRQIARYRPLQWQRRTAAPRLVTPEGIEITRKVSQTSQRVQHLHRLPWLDFIRHIRSPSLIGQSTATNLSFGAKKHVSLAEIQNSRPGRVAFGEALLLEDYGKDIDQSNPAYSRAGITDGPTVLSLFEKRPQSLHELSDCISSLTSALTSWTKAYTINIPNGWPLSALIPQIMHENPEISIRALTMYMAFVVSNNLGHAFSPELQARKCAKKKAVRYLTTEGDKTDFTMNAMSSLAMLRDRHLGAQVLEEICAVVTPTRNALLVILAHSAVKFGVNDLVIGLIEKGIMDADVPTSGEHPTRLLETAITSRNNDMILFLHREGVDIQCYQSSRPQNTNRFYDEATLPSFIYSGDHESCALSIAANLENPDRELLTLLHQGARPSNCDVLVKAIDNFANLETVRLLLEAGADPNQLCHFDARDRGSVHSALNSAIERGDRTLVDILLQHGADVDGFLSARHRHIQRTQHCGYVPPKSPLLLASEKAHEVMVEELLQRGANPNLAVFDLGSRQGAFKIPFKTARARVLQTYYAYPMQAAVGHGNMALTRRLKEYGASLSVCWGTPLIAIAAFHDHEETLEWLIKEGADVNATTASQFGFSALEAAIRSGNMDLVDFLCRQGADVNLCPEYEGARTPLQAAAESGEGPIFDYLLELGADIHAPASADGISVLEALIWGRDPQRLDKLIDMGMQVSRSEGCEGSPLSAAICVRDRSMVQKIVTAGAGINDLSDGWGMIFEDSGQSGSAWEAASEWVCPLLRAVERQNLAIVQDLLQMGARVDDRAHGSGMTPLLWTVNDQNYAIAECLLKNGADPNATVQNLTMDGFSPLIWAARLADTQMVELLLQYGADVNLCCQGHCTIPHDGQVVSLDAACEVHDLALIENLLRAGAKVNLGHPICACLENTDSDPHSPALYELLGLLISHGADINSPNRRHKRPLDLAVFKSLDLVQYLVQAGADIDGAAKYPQSSLFFNAITEGVFDERECDAERQERYTDEAYNTCEFLLQKWNGDQAWMSGLLAALRWIAQDGVLRFAHLFLKHGVPVSTEAVYSAAEFGRLDMLKLLLDNYIGPEDIHDVCEIATECAGEGNQLIVIEFLESYQPPGNMDSPSPTDMEMRDEEEWIAADREAHEDTIEQLDALAFTRPVDDIRRAELDTNMELDTAANADIATSSTALSSLHVLQDDVWLTMPPDDPMEDIRREDAEFFA